MGHKKLSEGELITAFRLRHGDKYQYAPFPKPFRIQTVIDIVCPIHGSFRQSIWNHKSGQGCPQCGNAKNTKRKMLGRDEWVRRFESVHGRGKYDYSRVQNDLKMTDRMEIYCPEHGVAFFQTPDLHWRFRQGCPVCAIGKRAEAWKRRMISRREFERRARAAHGLAYEYTELPAEFSLKDSIIIYCNEHDHVFFCGAQDHLKGKGCPKPLKI